MHDIKRRVTAVAIGTVAALATAAPAASAGMGGPAGLGPADYTSTAQAAAWLATQLTGPDKDHYNFPSSTYADDGNTADGLLALDAAGVGHRAVERMLAWLESDAANYAGTAPNFYPGSLAKLLIVAEAEHVDPHSFGGIDLVASLRAEENTGSDPARTGLYQDPDTQYGYESTISQALALIALSNTGDSADAPDAAAVSWLTDQQCPDGGFRNNEPPHTPTGCTSELDVTAFAIQALVEVGGNVTAAVNDLDGLQNADGGFGTPTSNANSTAVAAQALLAAGEEPTAALLWLRKHQIGCNLDLDQEGTAAEQKAAVGAITFDSGGYQADSALRATTQALQAMALAPLATIDGSDVAARVPSQLFCTAVAGSAGGGAPQPRHHAKHHHKPAVQAATLPRTGPTPLGPTAGVAADLLLVGGMLMFFARRRRSS